MSRDINWLVLLLAGSLVGCAQAPAADSSADSERPEPSESQLQLYYDAYELFLEKTFPLDSAGYLSVQVYKDMPRRMPEDLEFSFSIIRPFSSDPVRVQVLAADQDPVVSQIFELATRSRFTSPDEILANLRLVDSQVDIASCPSLERIQKTWQPRWLETALPVPSEELIVRLHPRVVRISVQRDGRTVTLETRDPDDPPFRWGVEATTEVRKCVFRQYQPAA